MRKIRAANDALQRLERPAAGSNNGSTIYPEDSAVFPIDDAQAKQPEIPLSVRDDTVSAPVITSGAVGWATLAALN
jgi:hypothetical protein